MCTLLMIAKSIQLMFFLMTLSSSLMLDHTHPLSFATAQNYTTAALVVSRPLSDFPSVYFPKKGKHLALDPTLFEGTFPTMQVQGQNGFSFIRLSLIYPSTFGGLIGAKAFGVQGVLADTLLFSASGHVAPTEDENGINLNYIVFNGGAVVTVTVLCDPSADRLSSPAFASSVSNPYSYTLYSKGACLSNSEKQQSTQTDRPVVVLSQGEIIGIIFGVLGIVTLAAIGVALHRKLSEIAAAGSMNNKALFRDHITTQINGSALGDQQKQQTARYGAADV